MFVNQVGFFLSISRDIHFITTEAIVNRKEPTLTACLKNVYKAYLQRGFRITHVNADLIFECCRGFIATDLRAMLNIAGEDKDEHVPEIERCIGTVKERTCCTYNVLPFERYPPKLLIEMVFLSLFWLNAFPNKQGISRTISPRTIVTGKQIDYPTHCRVEFGQYVQTHEKHNDSMVTQTVGALALRPTNNAQGGYYFYSLATGGRLNRTHWTKLPMPDSVRDRVHTLARRARADQGLTFTNGDGNDLDLRYPEDDDDNNSDYDPDDDDGAVSSDNDSDDGYIAPLPHPVGHAGVDNNRAGVHDDGNNDSTIDDDDASASHNVGNAGVDNVAIDQNDDNPNDNAGVHDVERGQNDGKTDLEDFVNELEAALDKEIHDIDSAYEPDNHNELSSDDDLGNQFDGIDEDEETGITNDQAREQARADMNEPSDGPALDEETGENDNQPPDEPIPRLRRNRARTYGHLKGRDGDGSLPTIARPHEFCGGHHQAHVILQSIVMTQYNLKFGTKGKAAVMEELQQLYDQDQQE
jgi:hypothetical protein